MLIMGRESVAVRRYRQATCVDTLSRTSVNAGRAKKTAGNSGEGANRTAGTSRPAAHRACGAPARNARGLDVDCGHGNDKGGVRPVAYAARRTSRQRISGRMRVPNCSMPMIEIVEGKHDAAHPRHGGELVQHAGHGSVGTDEHALIGRELVDAQRPAPVSALHQGSLLGSSSASASRQARASRSVPAL